MAKIANEFFDGIRAELPILVGVVPFGMIYGVLAMASGLTTTQSQAMSAIVFAGSSQFVATQMISAGTPGLVMILTIAVINLRHALYSASMAPYLHRLRPGWKWLLAYLLTDEAYVVSALHYQNTDPLYRQHGNPLAQASGSSPLSDDSPAEERRACPEERRDNRHWFLLGAGLALWGSWQLSTAAGIFLGAVVPSSWSLDFTLALTFIALVVPNLKDRAVVAAALSAGVVAIIAFAAPYKLGLMIAALAGIATGLFIEAKT